MTTLTALALVLLAAFSDWSFAGANEDGRVSVPAGEAQRLGGDEVQQAVLADAVVTDTEYSLAVGATVRCIRSAGVAVSDASWEGTRLRYTGGPFATKDELVAAKPVMQACYESHLRGIDVARGAATTP